MADQFPLASDENESLRLSWLKESCREGDAFIKAQKGYTKIDEAINTIMSADEGDIRNPRLSGTSCNQFGKIALDLAAGCTDIKPFWEYHVENQRFEKQGTILGKLALRWWLQRFVDLRFADAVKYSEAAGTGWLYEYYDPDLGDMQVEACDPRDVIPIRPASYDSIQDAYGVIYRRERTVNYLRAKFPSKANRIVPDRDGSLANMLSNTRVGRIIEAFGSPFRDRLFGEKAKNEFPQIPTCDFYTVYLKDDSVNESKDSVVMGDWHLKPDPSCRQCTSQDPILWKPHPNNNWSYVVKPDEKLYPNGRCIEFIQNCIFYDGPSIYWHGMFPFFKLTLDPYPWTWLGKGVLWDLIPLQRSLNATLRIVDDHMEKVARPDVVADKNAVSKAALERMDTRRSGLKFWTNQMLSKNALQIVYPEALPAEVMVFIQFCIDQMGQLSGANNMSQLMQLNQLPSPDTVEKITESMSPSVRLRSRVIEAFMREFAMATAFNFAQFYTLPMRIAQLGEDGVTPQDFDFDPGSFIPDYTSPDDYDRYGSPTADAILRGPAPRYERTKELMRWVEFRIAPASLLAASEVQRKLLYLQLSRAGLIDHWTLLEVLGIPGVGKAPASSITDRLVAEQQMGLGMQVNPVGRKASGEATPRLTVKESR